MTEEIKTWVIELARTEHSWTPDRINSYVQRGWSFLGITREQYNHRKEEIIKLVIATRKQR